MLTAVSRPRSEPRPPSVIVVMGVSGCGKSTVARTLARRLHVGFLEADSFHPPANIARMSRGVPLSDVEREPWLEAVGNAISDAARSGDPVVVACSALRRRYREHLKRVSCSDPLFVLLEGPRELLQRRVKKRRHHFMPPALLDSQLETLERPGRDEYALAISIAQPVRQIVLEILSSPGLSALQ